LPVLFSFYVTSPSHIYTLSLHDALPISIKHPIIFLTPGIFLLLALFFATSNQITNTIHASIHDIFHRTSIENMMQRIPLLLLTRSEEHTSELQSPYDLVCRLLLEKKKKY